MLDRFRCFLRESAVWRFQMMMVLSFRAGNRTSWKFFWSYFFVLLPMKVTRGHACS